MKHDPSLARVAAEQPAPSRRGWQWGLVALWLAACAWLIANRAPAIATMALPDSDDDLRLLQVRDWLGGQGWFDLRQYRLDSPAGADIHWSRLVDLPLAAIIRPLTPLLGTGVAETVAVVAVPLLTLLAAMALLAAIARHTITPAAWWWAPLLLLMASPVVDMMAPLRIDHHGWQIVALLALLLGLVMPDGRRGGLIAGAAIAGSLTIGMEMLPFLAAAAGIAAIGWVADAREGDRLRWLCGATGVGILVALAVFIPPTQRFGMACDALSAAYAGPLLAGCLVLGIGTLRRGWRALWLGGVLLAAAVPLMVWGGTVCLTDPYHAVYPAARTLWLDRVSEAVPLWLQTAEVAWASLMLPMIGLAGALTMISRAGPGERRPWIVIGGMAALGIALALVSTRVAVAAQALALPGAAALGAIGRARLAASGSMLVRVLGPVLLFLCVSAILPRLLVAALAGVPATKAEVAADTGAAACMAPRALGGLNGLPVGTVLSLIDSTPAMLLHTHHRGLAGPYHRNGRTIADVMQAWAGTPAVSEAIVRRHRVTYVIACGDLAEARLYDERAPDGFHARLMRGSAPPWLERLPPSGPWKIWRVRQPLPGGLRRE